MITLVFDSPRPSTRSTELIDTSASITGPGSLAATTTSMSPIISEKRRSEPHQEACVTPETSRTRSTTRSASGSAIQIGVRSSERSASSLASACASFSSDFAPKPSSSRTRCSASAARRSSRQVTPSSLRSFASALVPRPWMRSSATTLAGCFWRSASSLATRPVSSSSRILAAVLLPMPSICWSCSALNSPRSVPCAAIAWAAAS